MEGAQASFKWDPFRNPIWISSKMLGADSNNVCTEIPHFPPKFTLCSNIWNWNIWNIWSKILGLDWNNMCIVYTSTFPKNDRGHLRCWMPDNQCQFFAKRQSLENLWLAPFLWHVSGDSRHIWQIYGSFPSWLCWQNIKERQHNSHWKWHTGVKIWWL